MSSTARECLGQRSFPARLGGHCPRTTGETSPEDSASAPRATVLVVDDDPDHRHLLVEMLNRAGCRAYGADAPQAMELVARLNPAMVVLDLFMPDVNGRQLADRIRRVRPGCLITISSVLDVAQYPAADDVLPKPIQRAQVTALVQRHLVR